MSKLDFAVFATLGFVAGFVAVATGAFDSFPWSRIPELLGW